MTATDDRQDFYLGEILVAPQHNRISLGEAARKLQPKVMAVLVYLARHQERVVSAEELMDELWKGRVVTQSSVQKSINSLRSALAELEVGREFVAHFSKRGYQLVVPVRFMDAAAAGTGTQAPGARIKPGLVLGVLLPVVLSLAVLVGTWRLSQSVDQPPRLHATEFHELAGFTREPAHERNPEPHPDGERVAYVRDRLVQGASAGDAKAPDEDDKASTAVKTSADAVLSQILIRDPSGQDWTLASAEGIWVKLAWSPSGRNLVAVEMRRAEGLSRSPAYYETPNYLYSFHIFTLDFSGRRLLEKNLLSQWQGVIASVTWWDENTLEFVASQGLDSHNERYRYVIAEQRLTQLNPLASGFSPQLSAVREKRSAVVSRKGAELQVEFLDTEEKQLSAWPIASGDLDMSWIPDGSGVLLHDKDSADLYTLYLNGDTALVNFPRDQLLSANQPRYSSHGQKILLSAAADKTPPVWLGLDGVGKTLDLGAYETHQPRFSPDGTRLVYSSRRNHQHQIRILFQGEETLLATAEKPVSQLIWPQGADVLLYKSGGEIWLYEFASRETRLLQNQAHLDPLDYSAANRRLWFVRQQGEARNIWQKDLQTKTEKQLTFGAVAGVLMRADRVYFQYRNQRGLWALDDETPNPQTISQQLPENSRLLRLVDQGIYFVTGGPCRESDIQYLEFASDSVSVALNRTRGNQVTHDFHPTAGVLQTDCALVESKIIELHTRKRPPG